MTNPERRVFVTPEASETLGLPPLHFRVTLGESGLFPVPPRKGDGCYLSLAGPPGGPLGFAVYLTRARSDDELLDEVRLRVVPRPPVRWSALTRTSLIAGATFRAVGLVHGVSLGATHCAAIWLRDVVLEGAGLLVLLWHSGREGGATDPQIPLDSPFAGFVARSFTLLDAQGEPRAIVGGPPDALLDAPAPAEPGPWVVPALPFNPAPPPPPPPAGFPPFGALAPIGPPANPGPLGMPPRPVAYMVAVPPELAVSPAVLPPPPSPNFPGPPAANPLPLAALPDALAYVPPAPPIVAPPEAPVAPAVAADPAPAWLSIEDGGAPRVAVLLPLSYLGRGLENTIQLAHMQVSKRHARIEWRGGDWLAQDLQSANGTTVDGVTARSPTLLRDGSIITFGPCRAIFRLGRPPALPIGLGPAVVEAPRVGPSEVPRSANPALATLIDECARYGLPAPPVPPAARASLASFGQGFFSSLDVSLRPRNGPARVGKPPAGLGDYCVVRLDAEITRTLVVELEQTVVSVSLEASFRGPDVPREERTFAEACLLATGALLAAVEQQLRTQRWPSGTRLDVVATPGDAHFAVMRPDGTERFRGSSFGPPTALRVLHEALAWVLANP